MNRTEVDSRKFKPKDEINSKLIQHLLVVRPFHHKVPDPHQPHHTFARDAFSSSFLAAGFVCKMRGTARCTGRKHGRRARQLYLLNRYACDLAT